MVYMPRNHCYTKSLKLTHSGLRTGWGYMNVVSLEAIEMTITFVSFIITLVEVIFCIGKVIILLYNEVTNCNILNC